MLTHIVKATRAHYAALQHRAAPDRVPLDYVVLDPAGRVLTSGRVQVKARPPKASNLSAVMHGRRRAEMTRLTNRLLAMYPEAKRVEVSYAKV